MSKKTQEIPHPDIKYFNLGPWPNFVAFTTSKKAFKNEMKRLAVKDIDPLAHKNANATTHFLEHRGKHISIIYMPPFDEAQVTRECYAGLLAHEALHIIQAMQDELAGSKTLGVEAEAYLIQQIIVEALQIAWNTGMEISREP